MTCEQCRERMIDVMYGEEVPPRLSYEFFAHLNVCGSCDREYRELLETREALAEWKLPANLGGESDSEASAGPWSSGRWRKWLPDIGRIAAGIMVLFGAISLLQSVGLVPGRNQPVSEKRVEQMVQDLVVARQQETLKVIGQALLDIKEDMEDRNKVNLQTVYGDLYSLEEKYLTVLEENNQQLRRLTRR
jgi:hypothetical protein